MAANLLAFDSWDISYHFDQRSSQDAFTNVCLSVIRKLIISEGL